MKCSDLDIIIILLFLFSFLLLFSLAGMLIFSVFF